MKTKEILLTVLAAVLLTGCSAEIEQGQTVGGMPINLGYSVVTATAETRAATNLNNDALTLGSVAVSVKKHTDGTYTTTYNYTAAAGGALSPATASNQFYYETDGSSSDIIAYYPATASTTFSVETDQIENGDYQSSDLMWAQVTDQLPTNSTVNLEFSHLLTKIIVNASAGEGITSITSVTLNSVKPKVTFTPADGTVALASSDNAATSITMSNEGAAIIPPQTIDGSFITIVTNAGTAIYAVENKEFESGHQYTLNIIVNAAAIGATNTITGWTSQGTVTVQPTITEKQYVMIPYGAVPGLFTINSDGDQVFFSHGNLQYRASTGTWRFAENQYDYVGNGTYGNVTGSDNTQISSSYSGWIDLFGWGTSGWNNDNAFYQPYSSSKATSGTYTLYNGFGYGPTSGGTYTYSLTDSYANADWGVYNAISNGGNSAGLWRTLTTDEWLYLLGMTIYGSDASGHARYRKYFRATVNSVQGIVVLPDDISGISDIPAESSCGTSSTFDGKTYTTAAWSALESAGAVFLPAAGSRYGTEVNDDSFLYAFGYYWSTTAYSTGYAWGVRFSSISMEPADYSGRYVGSSVRLVRVAP